MHRYKQFFPGIPVGAKEYMKMPLHLFPQKFKDQYDIDALAKGDGVYMEIRKGMYGLPAAGIIANKLLKARLVKKGYFELPHTPGLWKHVSRPIAFTLVVDDFGVKYEGREHVEHLLAALENDCTIENDWEGKLYCGIELNWNYEDGWVDTEMSTYVSNQLTCYNHPHPKRFQRTPYATAPTIFGRGAQDLPEPDCSPLLDAMGKLRVQQVVWSFCIMEGRSTSPSSLASRRLPRSRLLPRKTR